MSKLIYSPTSTLIEGSYQDINSIDSTLNQLYYSVAFTGDGFMYTHGKKFRLFTVSGETLDGISFLINNGIAGLYMDGTSLGTGGVVQRVTGDGVVTATTTNGVVSLGHAAYLTLNQAGTFGSSTQIPIITVDTLGHITSVSNSNTIDASRVGALQVSTDGSYYILGVTDTTLLNPLYVTSTYFDLNGNLHANNLYIGNLQLSLLFAPYSHLSAYANSTDYGHVKITDTIDATLDDTHSTAATPKAVNTALTEAQLYANDLVAAQDAMVFCGTIDHSGVIKSHNSKLLKNITNDSTNITAINYKVGYTFRFTDLGTFSGVAVEPGDMIIATSDKNLDFNIADWTVIQTNINGALTSTNNLNGLLYANNSRIIDSLSFANGVLKYDSNGLSFVNPNTLWRDIQINSTSIGNNVLNLIPSSGITITPLNGQVTIGLSTSTIFGAAANLTIQKDNTEFTYNPGTASVLKIGNLLNLSINQDSEYVLEHAAVTRITSKLGRITTDGYGHVSSVEEVVSLKNPYNIDILLSTGSILTYDGSALKTLILNNGDDITFANSTNLNNDIIITPTITHKYRSVLFYPNLTANSATVLLANNVSTILTLVGGTNVTLSTLANNGDQLPAGTLRINAEDTWRDVQAYRFVSNIMSLNSISDSVLKFGSDFIWEDNELNIAWMEIDEDGRVTYVK